LGHFALMLALPLALVQATVPLWGASRRHAGMMALGDMTALAQFALIALAFAALVNAYVTSDFSVLNVAENSSSAKPLLYKISGVWANHEGSMMLWVLILTLFGAAVAWFGDNLPPALKARVLSVQAMIGAGFFLFILFTSDPFQRLANPPLDGNGLNPILQDPGLAFHPPMLYLGYVGFSVAFAFAVAALIEGKVDPAWARWVRPWTLAAWCALTIGIAMGSWWAYYTLGWGGWWFWDPVENASFMPWLAGTALLHSAIVVEKRDALKSWTVLLAILAFSLSLVGTFLVRSGVLTSVHAFALDPRRGLFILILLAVAIGGSLLLYAIRAPALKGGGLFAPISREGALVLNNILLATGCATVFLGTLYPLFLDAVGGPKLSVGFPFFNRTFVPLMVPLLLAVAAGPFLAWKRGDLGGALQRLWAAFGIAVLVGAIALYVTEGGPILAVGGLMLAAWVGGAAIVEWVERTHLNWRRAIRLPRATHGMSLAHLGLAVTVAGIAASAWQQERIVVMHPGDDLAVGGYTLHLDRIGASDTPSYHAERADVT
ncbi:MAG: heme lyase CcmF/NrfE family subunit, partial [Stellaceae bacterium]